MNDERRMAGAGSGAEGPDPHRDELDEVLEAWVAPEVPRSLDRRVLASYRELTPARPLWVRFFTSTVRVPLPVATAAVVLLVLSAVVALRPPQPTPTVSGGGAPIRSADRLEAAVVTHTDLSGFQPARDSGATIVLEGALQ
jgi:hypothetical protein